MRYFLSILLCGFLACHNLSAQKNKIDSLKQIVKLAKTDSAKIHALKNVSWEYLITRSNAELAKIYIDSIISLSSATGNVKGIADANYQYTVLERQKGNYSEALSHIEKYLTYKREIKDSMGLANGLYQKAIVLDDQGEYEQTSKIYYDILKIYEAKNDAYSIATIQNALGDLFKKNNKFDQAMEVYLKALKTFTDLDKKADMANAYYNIGGVHRKRKNYSEALNYFNKALLLDQELEIEWGTAYDYEAIGEIYGLQKNYDEALKVHLMALEIREKLQQKRELAESNTHVGTDYLKLKDYPKAKFHLEKSIRLAEEIGAQKAAQDAYEKMSMVLAATGDYKNALFLKDKYITIKDSLFNETKSKQLQELQVKFDSEKKQDAITTLQKDAEIKDLLLERQRAIRNVIIGLSVITLLFSYILFNRYRRRQKDKRAVEKKQRLIDEERQKTQIEKQRVAELQKIDKLKDEFLANTSHELRTPLNGIIGLSESLKDGVAGQLNNKAIENLDLIVNSGKRLSHLVNDILDFSKLKNKDISLSITPVDLHSVAEIVLKLSEPLILDKELKLINSIPRTIPFVDADENRLQQILYNIIGNAIKFTEKGYISIFAEQQEGILSISISDTGIGIPHNQLDTIFNSFEQGDGSTERKYGGTGLGLSVTKQLIELHNGTISVSSEEGKGSIFTITLPVSATKNGQLDGVTDKKQNNGILKPTPLPKEPELHSAIKSYPTQDKKYNILIVDDEPINRRVLQNHLSVAGYGVVEASSGKEAMKVLQEELAFDLVLLDIMMPGMSGYEVCEKIREDYQTSELPIIMLTAKNGVSELVQGFNSGANDYLTKPFSKNELLSRIKTHLNLNSIHKATSRFVPGKFIKSIGRESITDVVLGDFIEKNVTVLFTDIRDYTRLSETMTPEQNFKFVNAYVGRMGPIIQQNQGFVNQYLGDGIMALFPHEAEHALDSAIEMQRTLSLYNNRRIEKGYIPIAVGMGLHTGPLVMGIIGDMERNDTAIIADTVNTASRTEGVTKYYGANIVISEDSLQTIKNKDDFNFRYLGKVKVKGKEKSIGIYECFDGDSPDEITFKTKTLDTFKKGLEHFFAQDFPKASAAFDKVLDINPKDGVAKYFVSKSAAYTISGVPKDWGIVNTMSEK